MAAKYDIAQYLVNLHTLLQAQESAGGVIKSQTLAEEYHRNWDLLKQEITNETGSSDGERDHGHETGTDRARDEPGRRI